MSSNEEEGKRLEALWQGNFGDEYTARNADAANGRLPFWKDLLSTIEVQRVLEVGCNLGANLRWLASLLPPHHVYGIDVNNTALAQLRRDVPTVNAVWSTARSLPFRDRFFDLVYTTGVLIHQPQATLPEVMTEIVRCSSRYVLAGEYYAPEFTEVPYRGQEGALFKLDFGAEYTRLFPELKLVRKGFLPRGSGWDDITWWLLERASS
jgi:pseudaminic acid biosynthesis-associated methylase